MNPKRYHFPEVLSSKYGISEGQKRSRLTIKANCALWGLREESVYNKENGKEHFRGKKQGSEGVRPATELSMQEARLWVRAPEPE